MTKSLVKYTNVCKICQGFSADFWNMISPSMLVLASKCRMVVSPMLSIVIQGHGERHVQANHAEHKDCSEITYG